MWSIRFHGKDERETLARADYFFLENKEALGLEREEFFARLAMSEDGTEAAFVETGDPLWNLRGSGISDVVGTEPAVGVGPRGAEEPSLDLAPRGAGPESAQEEDAL